MDTLSTRQKRHLEFVDDVGELEYEVLRDRCLRTPAEQPSPAGIVPFHERFALEGAIGAGHFGVVRRCRDLYSRELRACKSIPKENLSRQRAIEATSREIFIMSHLRGHKNVVELKGIYEDDEALHLVMEFCEGGELYDQINSQECFTEREAGKIFMQVASAVAFCHSKGIMHRDLKPENILLAKQIVKSSCEGENVYLVKLADFGLALCLKPGEKARGVAGSPLYMAPEVTSGEYDLAADVWSLGVILYILLCGYPPFFGENDEATFSAIRAGSIDFSGERWAKVSSEAKSLVRSLLSKDLKRRPSAQKILTHPWLLFITRGGRVVRRKVLCPAPVVSIDTQNTSPPETSSGCKTPACTLEAALGSRKVGGRQVHYGDVSQGVLDPPELVLPPPAVPLEHEINASSGLSSPTSSEVSSIFSEAVCIPKDAYCAQKVKEVDLSSTSQLSEGSCLEEFEENRSLRLNWEGYSRAIILGTADYDGWPMYLKQ